MALTDSIGAADLAAIVGNNDGFGGNNGAWWLLILLIFANNGWGGNGWGGNANGVAPYMMGYATQQDVQNGFDQAAVMSGINGITNAISSGFAGAEISRTNALANLTNQLNTNAMALQQCCCQNAANTADLKFTVATEACADRSAITSALRDILEANNASTQRILDQLCQDKIDSKNEKIAELQNQLTLANLAASQNAQTAAILANNEAQTATLEAYLSPVPKPAFLVQNPNCCGNYYNSSCGCNA